jgi:acyl-CoA reductase-like NAD-dependent aldehyde dehydrogenase
MKNYQMWIDGKFVDALSGKTFPVLNPATEEVFATAPLADQADVDIAVEAAKKAFPLWSQMPLFERTRILLGLADLFAQYARELGEIEMLDHGFPKKSAMGWGWFPSISLRDMTEQAKALYGETAARRNSALVYMQYEPLGVCGLITPWNVPLLTACCKISPCLATGNTCVVKPSSIDCLPILTLAKAIEKSELPPGMINIVTGPGSSVGEALALHKDVRMVSFTGSSETGKRIMSLASTNVKRMNMELGGKNPFIVLDDADIDLAVEAGIHGVYYNCGQVCAAAGKFYVHEKVYEEFVKKFVDAASKIKVGPPEADDTEMGPLASKDQRDTVEGYIQIGVEEGAKLALGGSRHAGLTKGYYLLPTVLVDATHNMTISKEEIFGPVAVILKFSGSDDIIGLANDNVYGLAASVWSKDTAKVMTMANKIQAGTVWVNGHLSDEIGGPWGGFKESGFGKEGTKFGLREYIQLKTVYVDLLGTKNRPCYRLP